MWERVYVCTIVVGVYVHGWVHVPVRVCSQRDGRAGCAATSLYLQPLNLNLSGVAEKPPSCTGEDRGVNTLAGPSSLRITHWC